MSITIINPFVFATPPVTGNATFTTTGTETGPGIDGLNDADTSTTAIYLYLDNWIKIDNDGVGINSLDIYYDSTPETATIKVYSSATGAFAGEETEVNSFTLPGSGMPRNTVFGGSDTFAMLKMTAAAPFPPAQMNVKEIEIN